MVLPPPPPPPHKILLYCIVVQCCPCQWKSCPKLILLQNITATDNSCTKMKKKRKKSTYEQFSCIYILINSQATDKHWHWSNWNLLCISLFDERYPEFPWLFTVPVYQLTIHTRKAIVDEDGLPMAKTPEIEADHALVAWPCKLLIGWHNLQWKRGKTECEWKKKNKTDMMRRKRERAGLNGKMMMMMSWCLMSSDVIWHIRDKLWPMPKHGAIKSTYVRCMRV